MARTQRAVLDDTQQKGRIRGHRTLLIGLINFSLRNHLTRSSFAVKIS